MREKPMDDKYTDDGKRLTALIRKVIEDSEEIETLLREIAEPEGLAVVIEVGIELGLLLADDEAPEPDATGFPPLFTPVFTPKDEKFLTALRISVT